MTHSVSGGEIVVIDNIPPEGLHVEIEAGAAERAAIAARLGVPQVNRLKGVFKVVRSVGGVDLDATIDAAVIRECVVSLEPFEETIAEPFRLSFARQAASAPEIEIDEETPEPLEGEALDLGEILIQQLSLAMAAYPRKPGAASLAKDYAPDGKVSPFAGLKATLEKERGGA